MNEDPPEPDDTPHWDQHTIPALRKRHDWTQAQLAEALPASLRAVQMWEAGRSRPGPQSRAKLTRLARTPRPDQGLPESQLRALIPHVLPLASDAQLITEVAARFARPGPSRTDSPPIPPGTYRIVTDESGHVTAVPFDPAAETGEPTGTGAPPP